MGLCMFRRTHIFIVSFLLWITGCAPQKVYFDCGAKVDVVDVQGLILSPGFPYNYSSGTHCVWQFFVPVGHQLIMEMFDFDVFENHNSQARFAAMSQGDLDEEEVMDDTAAYSTLGPEMEGAASQPKGIGMPTQGGSSGKELQSSPKDEVKPVVVQEQSTKMEMAKVSNSAKWSSSSPSVVPSLQSPSHQAPGLEHRGDKALNAISPQGLRADSRLGGGEFANDPTSPPPSPTETEPASPETQQSQVDACPHDVLYISDLITFSSRYCGANRPASSQLVFGSSDGMVEVIIELITTTHWGRGFALLFHYRNRTDAAADQRFLTPTARKMDVLLATVGGAAFFAAVLSCVLFIIFRPKLCAKGASASPSSNPEVPQLVQNPAVDVSELQLVPPNDSGQEAIPKNGNNNSLHSQSLPNTGLSTTAGGEVSTSTEQDNSSGWLTELELGTDEVFVISSGPSPSRLPFCLHAKERFLRHSDTGPSQVRDWPSPEPSAQPTAAPAGSTGSSGSARPRAWSVRTFQDFLPPLPQLHKRWCSWNSTSPFTKLVDSAPSSSVADCQTDGKRKVFSDTQLGGAANASQSESSMSNASYPLAQPAQRQRRLNSTSNLRRTRFGAHCFGLLSGSPECSRSPPAGPDPHGGSGSPGRQQQQQQLGEAQAGKIRDFAGGGDDHVNVPVFAISEEEDRQPLVLAEQLGQASVTRNGLSQGKRLVDGGPVNGSVLSRGKSEWRPWANSSMGEAGLFPADVAARDAESALVIPNRLSGQIQLSFLSQ